MVKRVVIRIFLIFMVAAFFAVVFVQWLWIKYAIEERENQFSFRVHNVLNRTVNYIDEINYIKYMLDMQEGLGYIQHMGDYFSELVEDYEYLYQSFNIEKWEHNNSTNYLGEFLDNDISRLQNDRFSFSWEFTPRGRSKMGKMVNQEFIIQSIDMLDFTMMEDTTNVGKSLAFINDLMRSRMVRLIKEKDPQNTSIQQRLANIDVRKMLEMNFAENNIDLNFSFNYLTQKEISNKIKNNDAKNFYYVHLFPNDLIRKDYFLTVQFHSIKSVFMENMGWLFLASCFCIFGLMFVLLVSIIIIMRQQKLSLIKNDFINNMTHEFKTPIATISLATSAISKEKVLNDKEQILKFNEIIRGESARMNKYVERILQQAKLDRRELQLNKTEVDLNNLVKEATNHFILQVQNAGGSLELDLSEQDYKMQADEVHILNAVCNLLDNAIKYSTGAPQIEVYTRTVDNNFIIGVKDQGIGIPREAQKKVFKRFYRVTSGNLHDVKGFGLGLSYVKSIVELHNGNIYLISKKNKGTLVEIIFKIE